MSGRDRAAHRDRPLGRQEAELTATRICARIVPENADLDVLADLERRKNNKLRVFNDDRGIDSVPGHQQHSTFPIRQQIDISRDPEEFTTILRGGRG